MILQHKDKSNKITVVSNEEHPTNLCCNNVGLGCSSLDITTNHIEKTKQQLLEELSDIFILSLAYELEYERNQTSSNILPSIHKRTG